MEKTLSPRAKRGVVLTTIIVVAFGLGWLFRTSTPEQATTKASQEAKVELVSNTPGTTDLMKDDFFKVAPLGENPYGNLIQPSLAGVKADEETQTGSMKQIAEKQLEATAKNPATLVGTTHALLPDREIPKELTVEIDRQKYLSEEAQILWAELSTVIINNYQEKIMGTVDSIPAKGYTDGMDQSGNYIVSTDERDFTGKNGIQWVNSRGEVVYSDADCANWIFTTPPKGVKRGTIPPRNIPKQKTPPVTVSPKNIGEAPQNNPEVIRQDTDNVRPGANGNENAGVNQSPGTAYQGDSQADVVRQQQADAEAAAAAAQQQAAAAAAAAQQHQQAQQAAAAALAQQQQQAAAAAQQAQNAQQQQAAQQQQQQVANQQQAQQQNNQGTVTGGDGW